MFLSRGQEASNFSRGEKTLLAMALEGAPTSAVAAALAASNGPCSLFFIFQSLSVTGRESTGDGIVDLRQKLQDFHLAGFKMCFRTPQELVAWRITAGHLAVLQVLEPH